MLQFMQSVMCLSMSSPTPQVRAMLGIRRGFEPEVSPEGQEFDQLFVPNAKSFHFHVLVSGLLICQSPQVGGN